MKKCFKNNGHGRCQGQSGKEVVLLDKCANCGYYKEAEEFGVVARSHGRYQKMEDDFSGFAESFRAAYCDDHNCSEIPKVYMIETAEMILDDHAGETDDDSINLSKQARSFLRKYKRK